jgi:hypothetical protein
MKIKGFIKFGGIQLRLNSVHKILSYKEKGKFVLSLFFLSDGAREYFYTAQERKKRFTELAKEMNKR